MRSCLIAAKLPLKCYENASKCLNEVKWGIWMINIAQNYYYMVASNFLCHNMIFLWLKLFCIDFFYLFSRQQKLQLQCVHHGFFDYVNPKLPVPDTGVSGFKFTGCSRPTHLSSSPVLGWICQYQGLGRSLNNTINKYKT